MARLDLSDPGSGSQGESIRGTSSASASADERAANPQAPRPGQPYLAYADESGIAHVSILEHDRATTIGRGSEVDVSLAWDQSVSAVHAEVVRTGAHWFVGDEGISRNGTFVNNEPISGRRRLRGGDVIRVGRTTLTFVAPDTERQETTIADGLGPTATLTFLFTDLAGSTEIFERLGDEAGERFLREHFATLREAIARYGGREVKTLGDGVMVAFASASNAAACATAMQSRVAAASDAPDGVPMGLRVGLNAGEVILAEADYVGACVVVAKRLCDLALPGQILASFVVRALVGSRVRGRWTSLGMMPLKGLADPIEVLELDWRSHED